MILIFIFLIILNIIFNLDNLMFTIYNSLFIWFYNIFPAVFIFYMISSYLYHNLLINKFSKIFKYLIRFESDNSYSLLLINIFLGNPGTASLINEAFNNNQISFNDFKNLNNICIFINPLFILSFFDYKIYLIYFCSIIIFIKLYSLFHNKNISNNITFPIKQYEYTFNTFTCSLNNVINILLNIACISTFFSIIKNTIIYVLNTINFNNFFIIYLLSFLELATGIKENTNNFYLCIFILISQGFSILMQSFNVLNKKNISFKRYILNHIIITFIVFIIFFVIYFLFHKLQLLQFL